MGFEGEFQVAQANPLEGQPEIFVADGGDQDQQGGLGGWLKRQGRKIEDGAKKLGNEVGEQVQNIDLQQVGDAARRAANSQAGKQIIGGITGQETEGAGGIIGQAGKILFPQGQIIGFGGRELGGLAARKFAKQLLEDPASMAVKLDGNFDLLDDNHNKFIHADELKNSNGLMGLLDESRGLGPILARGYTTLANLDGKDQDLGVGRGDVQMLKLLTNPQLRDQAIADGVNTSRLQWGGGTLFASMLATGGLKAFAPQVLKGIGGGKLALAITAATAVGSLVGGALKSSSLSSDFAAKEAELKSTFESIRSTL